MAICTDEEYVGLRCQQAIVNPCDSVRNDLNVADSHCTAQVTAIDLGTNESAVRAHDRTTLAPPKSWHLQVVQWFAPPPWRLCHFACKPAMLNVVEVKKGPRSTERHRHRRTHRVETMKKH